MLGVGALISLASRRRWRTRVSMVRSRFPWERKWTSQSRSGVYQPLGIGCSPGLSEISMS